MERRPPARFRGWVTRLRLTWPPRKEFALAGGALLIAALGAQGLDMAGSSLTLATWPARSVGAMLGVLFLLAAFVSVAPTAEAADAESTVATQRVEHGGLHADDVVKVWDLSGAGASTADATATELGDEAVFTDHQLLHKVGDGSTEACFVYSTKGSLEVTQMTSSARVAPFRGDNPASGDAKQLLIDVSAMGEGGYLPVTNELRFHNAFPGQDEEWVGTRVDRPTTSLCFILLFSPWRPCRSANGEYQEATSTSGWHPVTGAETPQVLHGGQVVYWRISAGDARGGLDVGWGYRIRFTWGAADG